jgi:hypothetical protein
LVKPLGQVFTLEVDWMGIEQFKRRAFANNSALRFWSTLIPTGFLSFPRKGGQGAANVPNGSSSGLPNLKVKVAVHFLF